LCERNLKGKHYILSDLQVFRHWRPRFAPCSPNIIGRYLYKYNNNCNTIIWWKYEYTNRLKVKKNYLLCRQWFKEMYRMSKKTVGSSAGRWTTILLYFSNHGKSIFFYVIYHHIGTRFKGMSHFIIYNM